MQEHRLYRGQPKGKALVPSALRNECIKYMEDELSRFCIDTHKYKSLCVLGTMPQQYCQCNQDSFYAYWLSLVNCAITVNNNPICFKFCHSPFFTKNLDTDKVGVYGLSHERLAHECFNYAKYFFDSDNKTETLRLDYILHDYAFFQHFNHVLCKLDKSYYYKVLFPTLVLDWTWDYSIAEKFAGKGGTIISISYEAYEAWNLTRNDKIFNTSHKEIKTLIFGLCTYRDTTLWDDKKTDWDSWDNNLMIEQQGAVIFWPWNYTIDELNTNDLGRALNFRVDK